MPDERGFGGKCLPKDVAALVNTARKFGAPAMLMEAALEANAGIRQRGLDREATRAEGAE